MLPFGSKPLSIFLKEIFKLKSGQIRPFRTRITKSSSETLRNSGPEQTKKDSFSLSLNNKQPFRNALYD
jgi:hypothetical protein